MTIITLTVPHKPNFTTLEKLVAELEATEVSVREKTDSDAAALRQEQYRASGCRSTLPPVEQAEAARIIQAGGSETGVDDLIRFHEEDRRTDPSLSGRD